MKLWSNDSEIQFFREALSHFASIEQLFYFLKNNYFAYIPKGFNAENQTLQSRNSLIGQFTENWCKNLFEPIAKKQHLFALNSVVCPELGLTKQSPADLAFCTTNSINQSPENIKLIFEIKMSIVSNYKFEKPDKIELIGDYKSHTGTPSLLRSDSMLKAIGKSINIRVSGYYSSTVPIVIIGNSPIQNSYINKVDFLKSSGVIQSFLSVNPHPTKTDYNQSSPKTGFKTINDFLELETNLVSLLNNELNYFSSMKSKKQLGQIILISSKESNDIKRAEKFLSLIMD